MSTSLSDYCREQGSRHLLVQWHAEKNEALSPDDVTVGSHKKVWWRCEKGHEWQAEVKSRIRGTGCPVCARKVVAPGENDLATAFPEIAKQWHPTKNGTLTPNQVAGGSCHKVWWCCVMGHEWQTPVWARTSDSKGCPVCAGKVVVSGENDLATFFPAVANQWHPTKNESLMPTNISPYSSKKVWWLCEKGHEWLTIVAQRTKVGSGCPYCAGKKVLTGFNDLETLHPAIAAQWHPSQNGELTPQMVTAGSTKKVWWLCEYGHTWKAVIYSRTGARKHGCPACAGTIRMKEKRIHQEV